MTRLCLKSLIKITQVLCLPLNCKNGDWFIISLSGHRPQTKQLLPIAAKFEQKNGAAVMRKPLRGVMKLHQDFSLCLKDPDFFSLKGLTILQEFFFFPPLPSLLIANWITDMCCDQHLRAIFLLLKRLKTWVAPSLAYTCLAPPIITHCLIHAHQACF